ncbi:hypothetical protein PQC55_gp144 [Escherichia phage vB_EcoP-CHD5UKE1]|uniref:Uncharacterized protein n=1 Tax=Escherichia phage vB_EcoP-CHD5UKE1 TaxID=2865805 RepID=A0ABX9AGI1_9CAUD|nr:hypothetical protein PQC55_gp144 [Escherichia phage vB_EcoP-CHD5UKE1]QZI80614.1 hypothetical protein CHD5UKE1_118 [Escherichia phage vB_EcoP-CHD5UKE1]
MSKQTIKHTQAGYSYVNSPCCGARISLVKEEVRIVQRGATVVRSCYVCGNDLFIKGKV